MKKKITMVLVALGAGFVFIMNPGTGFSRGPNELPLKKESPIKVGSPFSGGSPTAGGGGTDDCWVLPQAPAVSTPGDDADVSSVSLI